MKRLAMGLAALGLLCGAGWARADIIYDANADFEAGWVAGTNPNGVWRYGRTTDNTGPLTLYTRHYIPTVNNNLQHMWDDPTASFFTTSSVFRNAGGDFDDGNVTFRAGALILHPNGPSGHDYAHVIFVAPAAGSYSLTGDFFAQQNNINVDVHVLVNGTSVFGSTITSNGVSRPFSGDFLLPAGGTIDFAVGPNGNFSLHPGNTGLNATIVASSSVPEPTSLLMALSAIMGWLGFRLVRRVGAAGVAGAKSSLERGLEKNWKRLEMGTQRTQLVSAQVVTVLILATLGLLLISPKAKAGPVYNANTDFDAGYAAGLNPNGVWTYGWSSTLSSSLVVYSRNRIQPFTNGQFMGWDDPANNGGSTPVVAKNGGAAFSNGNLDIAAGALYLHGGGNSGNDFSHVVFAAPAAGVYVLSALFIGSQNGVNGDVHVLKNGTQLFSDLITFNRDTASYSATLSLLAGDKIDFVVGTNGLGLHPNAIELQSTLSLQDPPVASVPEPSTVLLLGVGCLCLVCSRRPRVSDTMKGGRAGHARGE